MMREGSHREYRTQQTILHVACSQAKRMRKDDDFSRCPEASIVGQSAAGEAEGVAVETTLTTSGDM